MPTIPNPQPSTSTVVDTPAAAVRLGVSPATLATWRCTNAVRVPFARIGRRVVYRVADLDAFLATCAASSSGVEGEDEHTQTRNDESEVRTCAARKEV